MAAGTGMLAAAARPAAVARLRTELMALFRRRDYASLKAGLSRWRQGELRKAWPDLEPLEKAALFKLMQPGTALDFYRGLSASERYFLLGAFDPGAIAPILEGAAPATRALFQRFPNDVYDEMIRRA